MKNLTLAERIDQLESMICGNNDTLRFVLEQLGIKPRPAAGPPVAGKPLEILGGEPSTNGKHRSHKKGHRKNRRILGTNGLRELRRRMENIMRAKKINQEELGKLCATSGAAISGILRGNHRPSDVQVRLICAGLEIPYDVVQDAGSNKNRMLTATRDRDEMMKRFHSQNPGVPRIRLTVR